VESPKVLPLKKKTSSEATVTKTTSSPNQGDQPSAASSSTRTGIPEVEIDYDALEDTDYNYNYEENDEYGGDDFAGDFVGMGLDAAEETDMEIEEEPYKVLSAKDIRVQQDKDIKQVQDVLSVSKPFARSLLMFFLWDLEKLLEIFFSKGKQEVYKRAGLMEAQSSSEEKQEQFECSICFGEVDFQDSTALSCGHRFCNSCWNYHVSLQVKEGNAKNLACMGKAGSIPCKVKFDDAKIVQFLDDEQLAKYEKRLLESFVEDNPRVKWCPSTPHCGNAIMITAAEKPQIEVTCRCKLKFCFNCGGEPHSPCSCEMVRVWDRRLSEKKASMTKLSKQRWKK